MKTANGLGPAAPGFATDRGCWMLRVKAHCERTGQIGKQVGCHGDERKREKDR